MKYIDADRLKVELIKWRDIQPSTVGLPRKATYEAMGVIQAIDHALSLIDSLQQDEKAVELEMCSQSYWEERGWMMIPPDVTLKGIESLLEQVRKKLQQEQPQVADASKMEPEVDLEEEANECWDYVFSAIGWNENSLMAIKHEEFLAFARHFYELGLNARKEESK